MLKEWTWKVMVGGEVPDIVKQLRELEAAQKNSPAARQRDAEMRVEVLRDIVVPSLAIVVVVASAIMLIHVGSFYGAAEWIFWGILNHATALVLLILFTGMLSCVDLHRVAPWLPVIWIILAGVFTITLLLLLVTGFALASR